MTPIDPDTFRRALAQFASGVTVVASREPGGRLCGLTVSSFCSVSLEPPLVLVCIDRRTDTHAAIAASGHFGISVLAEGQDEVSRRFASPRRDKFEELPTTEGPHQSPLIPGALAHLECRVDAAHEAGDHTIFVGEVAWLQSAPGRPLVYQRSGYHQLKG